MSRKNLCWVCSIVLWVISLLLLGFAIWGFIHSVGVISQAKATGQLSGSGAGFVIVNFYMTNSLVYFVYALLLAGLGLLLQRKDTAIKAVARVEDQEEIHATARKSDGDKERAEWFEEAKEPEGAMEPVGEE